MTPPMPVKRRQFRTIANKELRCHACYRTLDIEASQYCSHCVESGSAQWHMDMIARWRKEVEE